MDAISCFCPLHCTATWDKPGPKIEPVTSDGSPGVAVAEDRRDATMTELMLCPAPFLNGSKFPAAVRKRPSARNQAGTGIQAHNKTRASNSRCGRLLSRNVTVRIAELTRTRRPARCFPRSPRARPPGPANDRRPTTVARDDRVSSAQRAALCRGHSKAHDAPACRRDGRVACGRGVQCCRPAASAVGSGPVLPRRSRAPRRKLEPPACRRRWRDAIESGPGLSGAVAANRRNALLTSALRVYLGPGPGRIWRSSARGERDTIRWHHIREAQQSAGVITIEGIASLSAATLNLLSPTMRPAGTIYEAVLVCRAVSWPPYLLNRRLT
jgi:hypothetical protein